MNSKNILLVFIFALLILNINNVSSLGVSPGRTTVNLDQGLEKTVDLLIVNSENKKMEISISVSGELKDYIELSEEEFVMNPGEQSRTVRYKVSLPSNLGPGTHKADIVILEVPQSSGNNGATVGATIAVISQVVAEVDYPGKYIYADLNINGALTGEDVTFVIPMKSLGDVDIVSIRANIDIYSPTNEKIATFNTDEISLSSGSEGQIVANWKADVPFGTYLAKATIIYDSSTLAVEKQFNVGEAVLELEEINVRDFNLGQIAKLEMLIENKWSENVDGVYTLTKIFDSSGKTLSEFKSATYDIESLQKEVMVSYWDSAGYKEGTYDASVYLIYGEKSTQKDLKMKVSQNNVEIIGLGYVISSSSSGSSSNVNTILIIAVVVLVLVNLLWFLMLRKRVFSKNSK